MHSAFHCVGPPLAFHSSVHTETLDLIFSCNVIHKLSKLLDN